MTDVEQIILDKLDKLDDNVIALHQKVDKVKDGHQKQITTNSKDIVAFKAKYGMIGILLIAVGNLIKPVFHFFKDSH